MRDVDRKWGKLELRKEPGGLRHYLHGKPVHAGASLLLRLPHPHEAVPVRYEGQWSRDGLVGLLYLSIADNEGGWGPDFVLASAAEAAHLAWPMRGVL